MAVGSTVCRAHQQAAGASRTRAPPLSRLGSGCCPRIDRVAERPAGPERRDRPPPGPTTAPPRPAPPRPVPSRPVPPPRLGRFPGGNEPPNRPCSGACGIRATPKPPAPKAVGPC
ncbi:hypothetical protein DEJ50_32605 [Streptomyces venezuelae]|uniref:Uncharacterized protein n=1 Tax=Streptomyces venezuelae TaxID=54571 RepID=A0A5P2D9Y1_STRVZ|nr:hypothetical protein DEJ50_32605 [Streptomyces venezuelae]